MSDEDRKDRSHLPMSNTSRRGLITYDAKDPDTKLAPIEPGGSHASSDRAYEKAGTRRASTYPSR